MSARYPVEPMPLVFDACRRVLDREMRPIHYGELTGLALDELGVRRSSVHWPKQIEDVREKCAEAGQLGIVYVPAPHCVALLREWVPSKNSQPDLFPTRSYTLGVTVRAAIRAGVEAQMRAKYMVKKTNAPDERVAETRYRGLLLEHQLREWFRETYPEFYEDPPNEEQWDTWTFRSAYRVAVESWLT
jgi:hypothetical protein